MSPNTRIPYYLDTLFFFLLLLLFNISIASASSTIPSLLKSIQQMPQNHNYVDSLNELAYLYTRNDPDEAEKYAQQACALALKLGYEVGLTDGKIRLGIVKQSKGEFPKALSLFDEALKIRLKANDHIPITRAYVNIGYCHAVQNNSEEAIDNYKKGLSYLNNKPIVAIKGKLYNNLSEVYSLSNNFKIALVYLDSSLQVWDKVNAPLEQALTLVNKANILWYLEDLKGAEDSYLKSLPLLKKVQDKPGLAAAYVGLGNIFFKRKEDNKAAEFYKKALDFKSSIGIDGLIDLYHNIGTISRNQGDIPQAISFFQSSIDISTKIQDDWGLAQATFEMGNTYKNQGAFRKAKTYYLQSLALFESDSDLYIKALVSKELADVSQSLGESDQAFTFNQQYNHLRDSIYYGNIDAANFRTSLEESQKNIATLELEISEGKRKTLWTQGLAVLLSILGLLLYFMFNSYRNKQLSIQAYQEVDNLLKDHELDIAYAQIEARDAVQLQIGQDLHDRLGLMLSTIKLYFNDFSEQLSELKTDTTVKQHKTIELLDDAVKEVRRISHDMQSGVLKKFGLNSAVKALAETINNSGQLKVNVNEHGFKERLDNKVEFKIYKILQELVGNVLKHAKAQNLTIYLNRQDELFNLIIEDNGIGFQPEKVADKAGMGLKNIAYRVSELNGTCHFDSAEGRGTSVIIDIPLEK